MNCVLANTTHNGIITEIGNEEPEAEGEGTG